jgi:hypothetical protein
VNLIFSLLATFFNKVNATVQKRFIFRQDDIEDFYHNTVQASMINWFIDNGVGISVGIISDSFTGQDPVIYNALKRCEAQGMDKCTIWNHGTDAAYHYGEAASVAEAQQKVQACDTKIKTIFPGYQPFLMVPHENSWGPFLLQALRNIGYKVISASTEDYSGMKWDLTLTPMQMPQQATTGDWDDNKNDFVGVPVSRTVADCEAAAAKGEVCVIMTHPHEFANGAYSLTTLAQLVQSLKAAGFTSTNFYTVMNEQLGGVHSNPTVTPTVAPTKAPVSVPTRVPTKIPVASPTRVPTVATTVAPSNAPVSTSTAVPTRPPVVVTTPSTAPTNAPVGTSTSVPTRSPVVTTTVAPSTAPVIQPVASATSVPTRSPAVVISTDDRCGVGFGNTFCGDAAEPCCSQWGWCGATADHCATGCQSAYGLCDGQTFAPTKQPTAASSTGAPVNQPVVASTVAPTNQPVASSTVTPTKQPVAALTSESPTKSPTTAATQLQYTAIIHVKSSASYQYQWLNVLETIRNVEKNQNLLDLQYSGNTEVSTSEFDISIKMTFGLTADSNPQLVYDTTARLLTRAIGYRGSFNSYYHSLGADKKTTFTRVTYQGAGTYEIHDYDSAGESNSSKHGLFSFPMSGANISILAAICFSIVLCFVVVGYFVYRRCYLNNSDSDEERKRASTISSVAGSGSNEEMLSPSERFVELELNNHYSLPRSDDNQFVEDACIHRHGLQLPCELENV